MNNFYRVTAQSDTFAVPSQKAEGGQISKCNIVLQELGGKYANSYVATVLGEQARVRFEKDDLVAASLRFSTPRVQRTGLSGHRGERNCETWQVILLTLIF